MPKLIDVAKAAGVSRSTASNVFNTPELVRPKLRQRVEAAARELGYAGPDPKARLMRAGKVNAIGVVPTAGWGVVDALRNPLFRQFMLGIAETCDAAGANLLVMSDVSKNGHGGVKTALVDGFILNRIEHVAELEAARLRRLPFVVVDVDAGPEINSARADARTGCRAAAQYLLDLGHRRFAIMSFLRDSGPAVFHPPEPGRSLQAAGMPLDQEKLLGYADALVEAGIEIDSIPMVQAHPWDREAARLLLDKAPQATAVLSMADMQAISVMDEARRRGLAVPSDLSVVGYNDIPDAALANLTTVDGMAREKGRLAANILFEGGPVRREVLPTRLIVRGSVGPAPL